MDPRKHHLSEIEAKADTKKKKDIPRLQIARPRLPIFSIKRRTRVYFDEFAKVEGHVKLMEPFYVEKDDTDYIILPMAQESGDAYIAHVDINTEFYEPNPDRQEYTNEAFGTRDELKVILWYFPDKDPDDDYEPTELQLPTPLTYIPWVGDVIDTPTGKRRLTACVDSRYTKYYNTVSIVYKSVPAI